MSAGHVSHPAIVRTAADFGRGLAEQQLALRDTRAWDDVFARACNQARTTGFAQLILERGPADYTLIDGSSPDALKLRRLPRTKTHLILDWN